MKFKIIILSILTIAGVLSGKAQNDRHSIHAKVHKEQLANNKYRMDRQVISDFVKNDVVEREKKDILSNNASNIVNDILKEARKHIGKRYARGAKGPNAFDCSGFSSYVFRQFGYSLSPSSKGQYTQGVEVDRKNLRKGDLVFFTSRNSGKSVGHVGIVTEADNEKGTFKFIHAANSGICISSYEGYYLSRYIGARRVIKD
jgi:cell wall-associated NlpC family hydrolase